MVCGEVMLGRTKIINGLCGGCQREVFGLRIKGEVCEICGGPLISEHRTCMYCRQHSFEFRSNHSLFLYDGMIKIMLQNYKFQSQKQLASLWAHFIASYVKRHSIRAHIVTVPGRRSSVRQRGWDQTLVIAEILKTRYGCSVVKLLKRTGGRSQKKLSYIQRRENLRGHIVTVSREIPSEILLLDDIFTTGASLNECARVLKKAGAEEVNGITIARAVR